MNTDSAESSGKSGIPSLADSDFERFSRFVEDRYGLYFSDKRRVELERGVWQAFAATTSKNIDEYYLLLQEEQSGAAYREQLVNALTVCETHFFRDEAQFDAIYHHLLPELIQRRQSLRTLRIWSAGCSSGEEPYSIAILLRELLPDVDDWAISILGTDINTQALERARKGLYGEWAFREGRARNLRSTYFRQEGNRYELIPEVRRMVSFATLNLASDQYPAYATNTTFMDLIICRNVTIYFPEGVTRRIINRFYQAQIDGGWLVVGHSEPSLQTYQQYQVRNFPNTVLYQHTNEPVQLPRSAPESKGPAPVKQKTLPSEALTKTLAQHTRKNILPGKTIAQTPARPVKKKTLQIEVLPQAPTIPARKAPQTPASKKHLGPEDPLEIAREDMQTGKSEHARDLLLKFIGRRPGNAQACALLGQAYANLGCWSDAERWCREAVRLDKLALEAYHTLALVCQHQGQLEQAIEMMRKVVYIDHRHVLGHYGLAGLYFESSQVPHALKSLDNARLLLDSYENSDVLPTSGGITAGRLRNVILYQQHQWRAGVTTGEQNPETTALEEQI